MLEMRMSQQISNEPTNCASARVCVTVYLDSSNLCLNALVEISEKASLIRDQKCPKFQGPFSGDALSPMKAPGFKLFIVEAAVVLC